tara:strand:+ start:1753 stop:3954 length:2202 start_codon:yes stop_codon:yes gene_type:complete
MAKFVVPTIFSAIDKFSSPLKKMGAVSDDVLARMERKMRKVGTAAFDVSKKSALIGGAIIAPLVLAGKAAVDYEDKLADIGKTTGLQGDSLTKLGEQILTLSETTRSSIDDIAKIAEIGGQLGIAQKDLVAFTDASNKFNVALGGDFSGGIEVAISQVGKINSLFAETKGLEVADGINKVGSAINFLGAKGTATSENLSEFTLRLGSMTEALKPTVQETLALGALFEESGINAEVASRSYSILLNTGAKNISKFSKQMGISAKAAENLINTNPTKFITDFSKSLKGLKGTESAKVLGDLGLGADGVKKVIGVLTEKTARFTELQGFSNKAFKDGTSLLEEYNTKNATTAAKLEIAKNKMQALAITIGNQVIPIVLELLDTISPMVKSFSEWVQQNKPLVSQLVKLAVKGAAVAFAISGISFAIGVFSKAMRVAKVAIGIYNVGVGIMGAVTGKASIGIGKSKVAMLAYNAALKVVNVTSKIFSAIMATSLGPIGLIITGVAALGVGIYALSKAFSSNSREAQINSDIKKRSLENTIDQRVEVSLLFNALRKAEQGSSAYNSTLQKLEQLQPGIIDKYGLQVKAIDRINAAEKDLIKTMLKRAEIQAAQDLGKEALTEALKIESEGPSFLDHLNSFNRSISGIEGADRTPEQINQEKADKLRAKSESFFQKSEQLKTEPTESANPDVTTQQSTLNNFREFKETVTLRFENAPSGLTTSYSGGGGFAIPNSETTH